jgi:C4-dicarboxylate-specific signal transduction histidine kinase
MAGDIDPVSHVENEIVAKDGSIRYIAWNNSCLKDSAGRIIGTLSSGQDITDRMLAEQELQRHQRELAHVMRLTTMGEMASGMAHELNQPLAAIVNYCQAAMHMLNRNRPAADIGIVLTRAMEQAHRAGDIIRHLREFVGKGATTQAAIPVNDIIRDVVGLIEWELRNAQVSLELRLAASKPRILADKVQIEQVVFNLLRNSLEAIQDAATDNGHIVVESTLADAQTVRVQVCDNGPGISPNVLERLFEPFRTTKAKAMGIGLTISQSIVEAHGGRLWFDRSAAEGACFGFDLPLHKEGVQA